MITFHSQPIRLRPARSQKRKRRHVQFHVTNCIINLHSHASRSVSKSDATIFKSRCSRTVVCYRLDRVQALPLVRIRFLRLANSSPKTVRSPARRSRDGRETSGKKSGEISCAMSAQFPGIGRAVATAMPPRVRQDDSQDNLPCARLGRAMSAPGTGETTRNTSAQQPCRSPRNGQGNISQAARGNSLVSF